MRDNSILRQNDNAGLRPFGGAREHEVMMITATLFPKAPDLSEDAAQKEILKWAQKRCGNPLPKSAWDGDDFDILAGGRNCTGVRLESPDSHIWTIRQDDPDKLVAGRSWSTEIVIGRMGKDGPLCLGARSLVNTTEHDLRIEPASPGFLMQLSEKYHLYNGHCCLSPEPWEITNELEVSELINLLLSPQRTLPVYIVSVGQGDQLPTVDPRILAKATMGIAVVAFLPFAWTWKVTQALGR